MFNLFNQLEASNDFAYILDQAGQDITINDQASRAVVTNTTLSSEYDDRYISTTAELERGQLITYNRRNWIVLSEVEAKRHHKYKAIMRHLTHHLQIKIGEEREILGYTSIGQPIYGEIIPIYVEVDAFAEQRKMMTTTGAIRLVDGDIMMTITDNEDTKQLDMNHEFVFGDRTYRVYGIDLTQKGMLILNCERK